MDRGGAGGAQSAGRLLRQTSATGLAAAELCGGVYSSPRAIQLLKRGFRALKWDYRPTSRAGSDEPRRAVLGVGGAAS